MGASTDVRPCLASLPSGHASSRLPHCRPSPSDHDVVVVGSRAAGAATAMLLARAGHDVVAVDRAQLPSDTTSTHSLVRGGVVQLSRWGLLDDVLDSGAPPVRTRPLPAVRRRARPEPLRLPVKDKAGVDMMLAPRRYVLDAILADAATRAGATAADRDNGERRRQGR